MYFGLTIEKLLLILLLAVFVVGPARLPRYSAALARLVSRGKAFMRSTTEQMREEFGPEFDEVDWKKLDPRQYDPRRIIRETLLDEDPGPRSGQGASREESPPTNPQDVTGVQPPLDRSP